MKIKVSVNQDKVKYMIQNPSLNGLLKVIDRLKIPVVITLKDKTC